MASLQDELAELTERMEKILHEELPDAARTIEADGSGGVADVRRTIRELDDVQRALGLKTFELLHTNPQALSPVLQRIAPAGIPSSPVAPGPDLVGDAELGPDYFTTARREAVAHPKGEAVTIACYRCRRIEGVTSCVACALPFCPEHVDPAKHPCGDLVAQ